MNIPSDMLRQGMPQLGQSMMSLNPPQFMQTQPQPGQQQQQQQQQHQPNHMGILPNASNSNPPMSMLGGAQPNIGGQQRFQLQMPPGAQQVNPQQRRLMMQQAQNAQGVGPSGSTQGSHMGGQLQNIGFPTAIMQPPGNNQIRRVASQPQPLTQSAGSVGGMHPGQQGISGMTMGMNAQTSMPAQLRQAAQQQQQMSNLRLQQHQIPPGQQMSPEMLALQQRSAGNAARTNSTQAQIMSSLPPTQQPHPGGIQQSRQNNFPTVPHQHQQQRISPSPRPPSLPQSQPSANMNVNSAPSQSPANRNSVPQDPAMFMNFQNDPLSKVPPSIPPNNIQFPFVPSSTSPIQAGNAEMSRSMASLGNPTGATNRPHFHMTPAQQYEQMQQGSTHLNMPPPQHRPPRPPSHDANHPHQQQPQHHSPPNSDPSTQPQRPQSQPQTHPGRPSSQGGPSHTPRSSQAQLASNASLSLSQRMGPPSQVADGQSPQGSAPLPIAPRPSAAGPSSALPNGPANESGPGSQRYGLIGVGQGLVRLLQFSGILASESKTKLQLSYWDKLVKEYFTSRAMMKVTLWKDNQRKEAKPFEIGVPIMPRFFLVTTQSGVKSMSLTLDGARERTVAPGQAMVECVSAVWTYKYTNGYTVTLRGPLVCYVVICPSNAPATGAQQTPQASYSLKIENLQFDANLHDKYISLDSIKGQRMMESPQTPRTRNALTPTMNGSAAQQREEEKKWEDPRIIFERASIPGEPVNAFGIPQATMRCLELAESVGQMADLITFSTEFKLGPLKALKEFTSRLRETQSQNPGSQINIMPGMNFSNFANMNGVSASPAVTLYSSLPPSANPPSQVASTSSPPKPSISAENSPSKQNKPPLPPSSAPSSTTASTPAGGSSSTHNTPALAHASLKRKQTDTSTTAAAEQAPPTKRVTRNKRRTNG